MPAVPEPPVVGAAPSAPKFKVPSIGEVKKWLGSLVAVAGAVVGFGVPNNVAHIVGLVSAAAGSLLVFLVKNDPTPPSA